MLRLSEPAHSFSETLEQCILGMAESASLRRKLSDGLTGLLAAADRYAAAASQGALWEIAPFLGESEHAVVADLTKSDLVKAYEQYFVPEVKVARRIYNSIMSAAQEKCPFCGGIGTPRNLDHYLPKAFFPQFSVLPINLIPACRDCNTDGKSSRFSNTPGNQPLQPYKDPSKFFDEQWVFAAYHRAVDGGPGRFDYFVDAPTSWSEVDQERAKSHFKNFDLNKRYSIKAAEHLGTVLEQMDRMQSRGLGNDDINEILLQPGVEKAPFANHWQKGMYQALAMQLS